MAEKGQVKTIKGDVVYIKGESSIKEVAKYYPVDHEVPKYYPVHDSTPYYLPLKLTHEDSLNVVRAFYVVKVYRDSGKAKDVQYATYDSVGMNKILKHEVWVKNTRPQTVIADNKLKVFIGASLGCGLDLRNIAVVPQITLITKSDKYYQLGYDVISRTPQIGMEFKLHFGK